MSLNTPLFSKGTGTMLTFKLYGSMNSCLMSRKLSLRGEKTRTKVAFARLRHVRLHVFLKLLGFMEAHATVVTLILVNDVSCHVTFNFVLRTKGHETNAAFEERNSRLGL